MAVNAAKARLKKNQLAVGIGVRLVRNIDIIKVMKAAGFDWLFLDLEHGAMSIETACEISTAARSASSFPMSTPPRRRARSPTSCATRRSATVRSAAARHSSTMRR
jgi:2-keto-3-deoxy-L-rhamnonate aldolase RhmA